jgi:ACS family glucarate transporter-like MFS transporter
VSVTNARKFTLLGCQIGVATVIAVGFIRSPMLAVALLVINVACEAGIGGMMFTIGAEVSPPKMAGSFIGGMNTVGAASGILAPILTGFIVKVSGSFRMALAVGGGFVMIAAISIFFIVQELKPLELRQAAEASIAQA